MKKSSFLIACCTLLTFLCDSYATNIGEEGSELANRLEFESKIEEIYRFYKNRLDEERIAYDADLIESLYNCARYGMVPTSEGIVMKHIRNIKSDFTKINFNKNGIKWSEVQEAWEKTRQLMQKRLKNCTAGNTYVGFVEEVQNKEPREIWKVIYRKDANTYRLVYLSHIFDIRIEPQYLDNYGCNANILMKYGRNSWDLGTLLFTLAEKAVKNKEFKNIRWYVEAAQIFVGLSLYIFGQNR